MTIIILTNKNMKFIIQSMKVCRRTQSSRDLPGQVTDLLILCWKEGSYVYWVRRRLRYRERDRLRLLEPKHLTENTYVALQHRQLDVTKRMTPSTVSKLTA